MDKVASGSQAILRCDLCNKPFDKPASLRRHGYYCRSRQTIVKPVKPRSCDHCAGLKARCDRARPSCSTCKSKRRPCHYPSDTPAKAPDAPPAAAPALKSPIDGADTARGSSSSWEILQPLSYGEEARPFILDNGQTSSATTINGSNNVEPIDWEALARMLDLSPPAAPNVQPLQPPALPSQTANFDPIPTTWYSTQFIPSPIPVLSIGRRFHPRRAVWPGAHRVQKMIFHTLRSYTLQIARNNFPPFIHPSSTSSHTGVDEKSLKPVHTCISLMKLRSGNVPGSAELFWRNVTMECEMWCEKVFSRDMFELMGAMQALAIYMIVRIDEGETEHNNIDELLVRTTVMLAHAQWRMIDGLTPGENDESEWKSWNFQESHRRLCVIFQVLNLLINFGPAGMCEHPQELVLSCLPAGKGLWEARDPLNWQQESQKHAQDVTYALDKSGELVPRTDVRELRPGNKGIRTNAGPLAWGPQRWDEWCAGADEFSSLVMLAAALLE